MKYPRIKDYEMGKKLNAHRHNEFWRLTRLHRADHKRHKRAQRHARLARSHRPQGKR